MSCGRPSPWGPYPYESNWKSWAFLKFPWSKLEMARPFLMRACIAEARDFGRRVKLSPMREVLPKLRDCGPARIASKQN